MSAAIDTTEKPAPNLAAGLVRAVRSARAVAKNAKNAHHGYAYASSEDVIAEAREALVEGGLAIFAKRCGIREWLPRIDDEDKEKFQWAEQAICVEYELVHESGETRALYSETPIMPEKGRPWDKALAAAKTFDLAYTLRTLLLLPRGEHEAPDNRDDRGWDRNKPAPSAHGSATDKLKAKLKPADPPDDDGPSADTQQSEFEDEVNGIKREVAQAIGKDKAAFEWPKKVGSTVPRGGKDIEARRKEYLSKAYAYRDEVCAPTREPGEEG